MWCDRMTTEGTHVVLQDGRLYIRDLSIDGAAP